MMMILANAEVPPLCSHRQLLETFHCRTLLCMVDKTAPLWFRLHMILG